MPRAGEGRAAVSVVLVRPKFRGANKGRINPCEVTSAMPPGRSRFRVGGNVAVAMGPRAMRIDREGELFILAAAYVKTQEFHQSCGE